MQAISLGVHTPLVCFGIAFPMMVLFVHGLWLGTGDCTNERVAHELNLHTRTLHRHLRNEGTSFQQIKDEVRRDLMLYYLVETDADFAWISERLGFAEQSVMTRRCNLWFAMSPTKVRAQARS